VTVDGQTVFAPNAIPDSAIGRWPIAAGSGTELADSIGVNKGTISTTGLWSSGTWIDGYALDFSGSESYGVDFSTYSEIGSTKNWSMSVTIETSTPSQSNGCIIQHRNGNGESFTIAIESGSVVVGRYDGSSYVDVVTGAISSNTKTRIFWSYSSGSSTLYLNGSEVTGSDTTPTAALTNGFTLGYRADQSLGVDGVVDEPIIYDAAEGSSTASSDYDRQPWS
jgi:hypothetical protein